MNTLNALSLVVVATVVGACDQPSAQPSSDPAKAPAAASMAAPAAAASAQAAKSDDVLDGCPGDESLCTGAAATDQSLYGKGFELSASEPLSAATKRLADAGEKVQVTGTVDAVCQKKGCWMVMRDGETSARVFTHAGGFFLPIKTNKGRKCKVEGELKQKTVTEKFAKHLEKDGAGDPSKVEGDRREWVLDATAIELL